MAKKKQPTYGEMARHIEKIQEDMKKEKERMTGVMATALMDNQAAIKLGDYSDADLKRIMSMLDGYVDECIVKFETEKQGRHGQRKTPE